MLVLLLLLPLVLPSYSSGSDGKALIWYEHAWLGAC